MLRFGVGLIIAGIVALVLRGILGSHIAEDGTLVEPFYLEASGKFAVLLGVVFVLMSAVAKLIRRISQ